MADEIDRYGLAAQFNFVVEGKSLTSMQQVVGYLQQIESSVKSASTAVKTSGLGQNIQAIASQVKVGNIAAPLQGVGAAAKVAANNVLPLRKEFRALKAEFRNVEFPSDLYDDAKWKSATREVHQYTKALKQMGGTLGTATTEEREFAAQLKSAQKTAAQRNEMAGTQRKGAVAGERLGTSQVAQNVGRSVTGFFDAPLAEARAFSKELSDIDKLAGYLTENEEKLGAARKSAFEAARSGQVKKDLINLSNATGTAREEVSALYADLAGAGKDFSNTNAIKAEAAGILRVKTALDISTDTATALDIKLGSVYRTSLESFGGIVKFNESIGSSFNVLADNLPNVKIDAQGIADVFNVLVSSVGDAENFRPPDLSAFAAVMNSLEVTPEVAGSFVGRFDAALAKKTPQFADALGLGIEEFKNRVNSDKFGVYQAVSEKFATMKGGDIEKANFLGSIGIDSSQDQKIIKGMANSLAVITDSRRLAAKGTAEATSIAKENNKIQGSSAFQTQRNTQLLSNFKTTLGSLLEQALLPFLKGANRLLEFGTNFVQQNQGLVKAVVVITYVIGALALALGTAGVAFFGFQQASATAELAMLTINRSIIPLTGFFQSSMAAFAGQNPISAAMNAIRGGSVALAAPLATATAAIETLGAASLTFLASPMGLAIAAITGLYLLLEAVTPNVSILGTTIGALTAPIAFVSGVLKGFGKAFFEALAPVFGLVGAPIAAPFKILGDAIAQVQKIWQNFSAQGEQTGYALAQMILMPFKLAATTIQGLWSQTITFIMGLFKPFTDFASRVGTMLTGALAENSPGPTFQIRQKWGMTIDFLGKLVSGLLPIFRGIGIGILIALSPVGKIARFLAVLFETGQAALILSTAIGVLRGDTKSLKVAFFAISTVLLGIFVAVTKGLRVIQLTSFRETGKEWEQSLIGGLQSVVTFIVAIPQHIAEAFQGIGTLLENLIHPPSIVKGIQTELAGVSLAFGKTSKEFKDSMSLSGDFSYAESADQVNEVLTKKVAYTNPAELANPDTQNADAQSSQAFLKAHNLKIEKMLQDQATGFQAMVLRSTVGDASKLVFSGTNDSSDMLDDLVGKAVGDTQFSAARSQIQSALESEFSASKLKVDVVGHSLGGSLAQTTAASFTNLVGREVDFNSPGVTKDLVAQFQANTEMGGIAPEVQHYIRKGDAVSAGGEAFLPGKATIASDDTGIAGMLDPTKVLSNHLDLFLSVEKGMELTEIAVDELNSSTYHAGLVFRGFEESVRGAIFTLGVIGEVILHLGRSILMGAIVKSILPKVIDGIFDTTRGSLFSAQKVGNRLGTILSEALMFPFESGGMGQIATVMVRSFLSLGEVIEGIFVNQVGMPASQFAALFIPESIRGSLSKLIPGLSNDLSQFFETLISSPKNLPFIGKRLIEPILNALGWESFAPVVQAINRVVVAIRPFFLLLETAIPGAVLAGLGRLAPLFGAIATVARPLAPLFAAMVPVLGQALQMLGAVLIVADLLKNTTFILKIVSAIAQLVTSTVASVIGLIATVLGYVQKGIGQIRVLIRSGIQAVFGAAFSAIVIGAKLASSLIAQAWTGAVQAISGSWFWLVGVAVNIQSRLVALLNHGAADAVGAAWERTRDTFFAALTAIVGFAAKKGQALVDALSQFDPIAFGLTVIRGIDTVVTNVVDTVQGAMDGAMNAIASFNPLAAVNHLFAEVVRGFIKNATLLGVLIPAILQVVLVPLIEQSLIPAILLPFARAVPLIIGLLANLGGFNIGPDLPFAQGIERLFDNFRDSVLSLGFVIVGAFTVGSIAPFIAQLNRGLTPVVTAIAQGFLEIRAVIIAIGGVIPYLRQQFAQLGSAIAQLVSGIRLPPWMLGLISRVLPAIQLIEKGLKAAFTIASRLTRRFLALPVIREVMQGIVKGAMVIGKTLLPMLSPLANWFGSVLMPAAKQFVVYLSSGISAIFSRLMGMAISFANSPLGQAIAKGVSATATSGLMLGKQAGGAAAQLAGGVARSAITAGQKVGEAYVVASKVSAQIQIAVSTITPYLRQIAARLGAVVANTGSFAKKSGDFYRSFYLQKAGVPEQIAKNAINPLDFLPGAKAGEKRKDKFKSALMADPFWAAREGTEIFDKKLGKLNKSFSGMGSAFNPLKTLPMLFTRPALAATVLFAQLEMLLGVVLLVAAAATFIYFRYPKTFHEIAKVINKYVIPALLFTAKLLMTVIPPLLFGLLNIIDLVGGGIKNVLSGIAAVVVVVEVVTEGILVGLWGTAKALGAVAKATRIVEHALYAAFHGNYEELKALMGLMKSFVYDVRDLIIKKLVGAWQSFTNVITQNQNAIRTTIAILAALGGVALMISGATVLAGTSIGYVVFMLGLLAIAIAGIILPGEGFEGKIKEINASLTKFGDGGLAIATGGLTRLGQIGGTILSWGKKLIQIIGGATLTLLGLYTAIVLVAVGLNPLSLMIAATGAFLTLSFTGHLEKLASFMGDTFSSMINQVRAFRLSLIDFILAPFSFDPLFQTGADMIGAIATGFIKALPLILIAFTLFNGLFKTGGNFIKAFGMSLKQIPMLFFNFLLKPIFQAIKALQNLSFVGGFKTKQYLQDFDTQTNIKAAVVDVRSRKSVAKLPFGVGLQEEEAKNARNDIFERRKVSAFKKTSGADLDRWMGYIEGALKDTALDLHNQLDVGNMSENAIKRTRQFTRINEAKAFGLIPRQSAEITDEGKDYLRAKRAELMRGDFRESIGFKTMKEAPGFIPDNYLEDNAVNAGLSKRREYGYAPQDLRSMAFDNTGREDFASGKIQKIYADVVQVEANKTEIQSPRIDSGAFAGAYTARGLLGAPLPKQAMKDDMFTKTGANATQNFSKMLEKNETFFDVLFQQKKYAGLPDQIGSRFNPGTVGTSMRAVGDETFADKSMYLERIFLAADTLDRAGVIESQVIDKFKSLTELMESAGNYSNSELAQIQGFMKDLGMNEEEVRKTRSRYESNLERSGAGSQDKAFKRSFVEDIYSRQYELLAREQIEQFSRADIPNMAVAEGLLHSMDKIPQGETEFIKAQMKSTDLIKTNTALGGRLGPEKKNLVSVDEHAKRQIAAETFELVRAAAYILEKENRGALGPQGIAGLRIEPGSGPLTGTDAIRAQMRRIDDQTAVIDGQLAELRTQLISMGDSDAEIQKQYMNPLATNRTELQKQKAGLEKRLDVQVPPALLASRLALMVSALNENSHLLAELNGSPMAEAEIKKSATGSNTAFVSGMGGMLKGMKSGDFDTNNLISGKFESAAPDSVRNVASQLGLTLNEMMTGRQMSFQDRIEMGNTRRSAIESLGMDAAKETGTTGKKASQFADFDNLAQEARLSKSDMKNILLGTGSLDAIESLAEVLGIGGAELNRKLEGLTVEVTKKKGLAERMKQLIEAPIALLTKPLQRSGYQSDLKGAMAGIEAQQKRRDDAAVKRGQAFEAIASKLSIQQDGKTFTGKGAIGKILKTSSSGQLKLPEVETYMKTGEFTGKDAGVKREALGKLGVEINKLLEQEFKGLYFDFDKLEGFDPRKLERSMVDRMGNQLKAYGSAATKIFRKGKDVEAATEGAAEKQITLLDQMASKPMLGRLVGLYRDYKAKEDHSLQGLLKQNGLSLKQFQMYMVDVLDVPFDEFSKLLRGKEVKLPTMKAAGKLLGGSPFAQTYQKEIDRVRELRLKEMEPRSGDKLIESQKRLGIELKAIEENAIKAFFGSKKFSTSPLPNLAAFVVGKLLKEDAPKLLRKSVTIVWKQTMLRIAPVFKRIAPIVAAKVWRGSSKLVGMTVRSLAGPLYRRFMPTFLKATSKATGKILGGAAAKLNAMRGLFPKSKIFAGMQNALLSWNGSLTGYFNKTADDIESEQQPRTLFGVVRSAIQRVVTGFSNFIQALPETFDRAKNQAANQARSLLGLVQGAFGRVFGLFRSAFKIGENLIIKAPRQKAKVQTEVAAQTPLASRYQRMKDYRQATKGERRDRFVGGVVAKAGGAISGLSGVAQRVDPTQRLTRKIDSMPREAVRLPVMKPTRRYVAPAEAPMSESRGLKSPLRKGGRFEETGMKPVLQTREVDPLPRAALAKLAALSQSTTGRISQYFEGAAQRSQTAWQSTAESVAGKSWGSMVKRAAIAGGKILGFISEASPGPSRQTRENWDHTAESVEGSMHEMSQSAQVAGSHIQAEMAETSKKSGGFFKSLKGVFGSTVGAGMAIGGAIGAAGFAMQSISSSLTTLGLLDEESSQALYKFSEFVSIFGTIGGLIAPVFGALAGSLGAIVTVGGTVIGLVFSPIGLAIAGTIAAVLGLNEVAKRLFGIDVLGGIAGRIGEFLEKPFTDAKDRVMTAWQGLVTKFGPIIMPIVKPAIELANKLISALNCRPTEAIPAAWEGAIARIQEQFFGWLNTGGWVADQLKTVFDPEKIFGGMSSFVGEMKLPEWVKGGLGGLGGLFGGKKKKDAAIAPVDEGVKLDQSEELKRARHLAKQGQGGGGAANMFAAELAKTKGQVTSTQLANLMTDPTTAKYMQQAETQLNNQLFHGSGVDKRAATAQLTSDLNVINQAMMDAIDKNSSKQGKSIAGVNLSPIEVDNFAFRKEQKQQDFQQDYGRVKVGGKAADLMRSVGFDPQGVEKIGSDVLNQVDQVTTNIQDRVAILGYGADLGTLMAPGMERVGGSLNTLKGDFVDFGSRSLHAIQTLDFGELVSAAKDFGGNFLNVAKDVGAGFWDMTQSAIAFGVFSFTSMSPLVLVLGGIALAVLGLAFNFLGLRNILVGGFKVIKGAFQVVYGLVSGLIQVISGSLKIISGLFLALTGDFSKLKEGWDQVCAGLTTAANGLVSGFTNIFGGLGQILKGVWQGFKQVGQAALWAVGSTVQWLRDQFDSIYRGVSIIGNALISVVTRPREAWQSFLDLLEKIKNTVKGVVDAIGDSTIGRAAKAVGLRTSGQAGSMQSATEMVDFDQKLKRGDKPQAEKKPGFFGRMFGKKAAPTAAMEDFDQRVAQVPDLAPAVQPGQVSGNLFAQAQSPEPSIRDRHAGLQQRSQDIHSQVLSGAINPQKAAKEGEILKADIAKLNQDRQTAKQKTMQDARDVGNALTGVLGTFAPALAAPLYGIMGLVDAFSSLKSVFPALMTLLFQTIPAFFGFGTASATATAGNVALAGSNGAVAVTTQQSGIAILWSNIQKGIAIARNAVLSTWNWIVAASQGALNLELIKTNALLLWSNVQKGLAIAGNALLAVWNGILAVSFGGIGAAASSAWFAVLAPILPIILAVGAVIAILALLWKAFDSNFLGIKDLVMGVVGAIVAVITTIVSVISTVISTVIGAVGSAFGAIYNLIPGPIRWAMEQAAAGAGWVVNALAGGEQKGFDSQAGQVQGFAAGGLVSGSGTGTGDRIPARLSNNEFVMPAAQTGQNFSLLEAMRGGMDVESILQNIPLTPPMPFMPSMGGGAVASPTVELAPITVNISFGDVVLQGATGPDAAQEFLDSIEPQLQQKMRELMRDLVEKMK